MVERMLDGWLEAATTAATGTAGAGPDAPQSGLDVDASLLGEEATTALLDLAREAAHNVARPAAPLATFAAGLALGRSGGDLAELREVVARIVAAAAATGHAE